MSEEVVWVKFVWDLPGRDFEAPVPDGYGLRTARPDESEVVATVSVDAYASDPTWKPLISSIRKRMTDRVSQAFAEEDSSFICATQDDRVVAVSGIAETHWTRQNFLTGICVLPGHQRRGLGLCLLAESLRWLRDRGLQTANVFTEEGSIADIGVYPHFEPKRITGVEYIDPPKAGEPD